MGNFILRGKGLPLVSTIMWECQKIINIHSTIDYILAMVPEPFEPAVLPPVKSVAMLSILSTR